MCSLCDCKQIIPVDTLVLPNFVISTNAACVDHDATIWVRLRVEKVVAFGAEVKRGLRKQPCEYEDGPGGWSTRHVRKGGRREESACPS